MGYKYLNASSVETLNFPSHIKSTSSIMSSNISKKTMRSAVPTTKVEIRIVYILVMGLTGAGKSTFVSVVTENEDIPIGKDGELDGGALKHSFWPR